MIAHLLLLLQVSAVPGPDSAVTRTGVVVDAVHGAPVGDALVRAAGATARSAADGTFRIAIREADTLRVTRIGYREVIAVAGRLPSGVLRIRLVRTAVPLREVEVHAAADPGRVALTRHGTDVRAHGGTSAADVAASLPLVSARSTTSRTAFSVRGSRAEQVIVTLDGVPLNDPATGVADPSDLPLGAIASATVIPGSDAARFGSGASGGVIALRSASASLLAVTAGSHGARAVEAAWPLRIGEAVVRTGAAWSSQDNDFRFRNTAAAPPADTLERRVNADVTRRALFASVLLPQVQLLALATDTHRGLAGPMNARDFDDDRGRARRSLVRMLMDIRGWELTAGARSLRSEFRDLRVPAYDSHVDAAAFDAGAGTSVLGLALRSGVGLDRVSGTAIDHRGRFRAFAVAAREEQVIGLRAALAARVDHLDGGGTHLSPSLALATQGKVSVSVRAARGFRAPSFYDLYLSTPQRAYDRDLHPERVVSDLELRVDRKPAALESMSLQWGAAIFARRTRDAIVWLPGNVGWSPHNVAEERVRGAEGHVAASVGSWTLDGWSAAYDARLNDGFMETRTPYVPYLTGGGGAAWHRGGTTVQAGLRLVGRRPFVNGPAHPELELPASGTLRIALAHMLRLGTTTTMLHVGVNDLANARAEEVRRHPSAGRTISAGIVLQPESSR